MCVLRVSIGVLVCVCVCVCVCLNVAKGWGWEVCSGVRDCQVETPTLKYLAAAALTANTVTGRLDRKQSIEHGGR
uniref:Putative secreted protein n=1 Tax=Anopheles darlingi TaxID=43151 RepID=A0A2M4DIT1_ANODA